MFKLRTGACGMLLALLVAGSANAQFDTETQDVTIVVTAIDDIVLNGGPLTLTINSGVPATDATTTYDVTTNGTNRKITGQLSAEYTSGITLEADLAAPATATSAGQTTLTAAAAADLVTDLSQVQGLGLTITYTASALPTVAPNDPAGELRTVTYTLTNM